MSTTKPPARSRQALATALERIIEAHTRVESCKTLLSARQTDLHDTLREAEAVLPEELVGETFVSGDFVFRADEEDGRISILAAGVEVFG